MQINETYWNDPVAFYTSINVRTGTSSLEDADYEDFPPFVMSDFVGNETPVVEDTTLRAAVENNAAWHYNVAYPDISIAYCGIKNRELPQCNVGVYGYTPASEAGVPDYDWCFKTNRDDIKPVMFISNARYRELASAHSNYTRINANSYYNPLDQYQGHARNGRFFFAPDSYDQPTVWYQRNVSYDMAYWRSFGIRTLFGVIYVTYCDITTEIVNGLPTTDHSCTLHYYESQTDEWKLDHSILSAYMRIVIRNNVNGTYATPQTSAGNSFTCDICKGMMINRDVITGYNEDVEEISPAFSIAFDGNNYDLPLLGLRNHARSFEIYTNPGGGMTSLYMACFVGINMGHVTYGLNSAQNLRTLWYEFNWESDDDLEYIRKAAAAYGLFFTDGDSGDAGYADLFTSGHDTDRWYSDKMCLGVIDPKGHTDGTYTRGLMNVTAPQWGWKDSTQSPYDPSKPPVPENTYSTQTTFNSIGDIATMTRRYVLTGAAVKLLGTALWDISSALSDSGTDYSDYSEKTIDQFLTNNPIDAIISLQRYPMEIPKVTQTTVKLGKTDTGISAYEMEKTAYFYLFSGTVIAPKFGDSFLDYQPYTKMELYVPFCGTIQMNPADIINRTLNVQLVVDFTTGTATGFVMSDDLVIETVNGNIAIDIPVTGTQAVTVASQLNNAIANKSNKTLETQSASLGNISAGGVIRAVKDPIKMIYSYQQTKNEEQRAEYEMTHQNAPVHIIGSASAVGSWAIDLQCRLIIYYPSGDIIRDGQPPSWNDLQLVRYGKTTGFACCIESSIGDMGVGLVVGVNPDLNGMVTNSTAANPATAAELDMLKAAIGEGIIVPALQ